MKLLFDLKAAQPIGERKYHGGSTYTRILFKNLVKRLEKEKDKEIICFYDKGGILRKDILNIINSKRIKLLEIKDKREIESIVSEFCIDRIYSALPYQLFNLNLKKVEFIFTIHGLRFIEVPTDRYELFFVKNLFELGKYLFKNLFRNYYIKTKKNEIKKVLNLSKKFRIIVPSYYTKYSLLQHFPDVEDSKIHVLYSPELREVYPAQERKLKDFNVLKKKYFLIVSGERWIKNSYRAIIALDRLFMDFDRIDKKVLILGCKQRQPFKKIYNPSKFIFHGYTKRSTLELLYKNAYCLIYPTLSEGFGYPPLESMKYGVPVLASAVSSLTEIYENSILYFNPHSIKEIKTQTLRLISEPDLYRKYSRKGLKRASVIRDKQNKDLEKLMDIILN